MERRKATSCVHPSILLEALSIQQRVQAGLASSGLPQPFCPYVFSITETSIPLSLRLPFCLRNPWIALARTRAYSRSLMLFCCHGTTCLHNKDNSKKPNIDLKALKGTRFSTFLIFRERRNAIRLEYEKYCLGTLINQMAGRLYTWFWAIYFIVSEYNCILSNIKSFLQAKEYPRQTSITILLGLQ